MDLKDERQAKIGLQATVSQLELEVKKLKADLHVSLEFSSSQFGAFHFLMHVHACQGSHCMSGVSYVQHFPLLCCSSPYYCIMCSRPTYVVARVFCLGDHYHTITRPYTPTIGQLSAGRGDSFKGRPVAELGEGA